LANAALPLKGQSTGIWETTVPAIARNVTGFGRGTVLEGINPGVLATPTERLRQNGHGCNGRHSRRMLCRPL